MQLSHAAGAVSAVFDEPNLVSAAGLVPVLALAEAAGLARLVQRQLSVPTDKGANAGLKVASLVAGMVAGADSIDDMGLLRHGGMSRVFVAGYAPSTLGSFLRAFTFGHVRQLDAITDRFLIELAARSPMLNAGRSSPGQRVVIDVDDTVVEVHGYAKQGAGFGYSKVRGLNALLATVATPDAAPVIIAQRLRKGSCGSPRGAKRLIADAAAQVRRLLPGHRPLMRADSAFYGRGPIWAALRGGCDVSVTIRQDAAVKAALARIDDQAWIPIEYPNAVFDEPSGRWISRAEVAEINFTAFAAGKPAEQVPGRLVVRRIPELNPTGQDCLFDLWRFHAFFTTSDLDTLTADKTHRGHAIIEQIHADLKNSALAHLPSGRFTANAAWLVLAVIAFNLTRAAATLTETSLAKATTGMIRRRLITVPARIANSARRLTLHLPASWPWQQAWTRLFHWACGPPAAPAP